MDFMLGPPTIWTVYCYFIGCEFDLIYIFKCDHLRNVFCCGLVLSRYWGKNLLHTTHKYGDLQTFFFSAILGWNLHGNVSLVLLKLANKQFGKNRHCSRAVCVTHLHNIREKNKGRKSSNPWCQRKPKKNSRHFQWNDKFCPSAQTSFY